MTSVARLIRSAAVRNEASLANRGCGVVLDDSASMLKLHPEEGVSHPALVVMGLDQTRMLFALPCDVHV